MSRTVLQTVLLNATPQHVGQNDTWSRLQAGGALHVVGCWHAVHGAFEISVPATSKANALAVAADRLKGTAAVSCYADITNAPVVPVQSPGTRGLTVMSGAVIDFSLSGADGECR